MNNQPRLLGRVGLVIGLMTSDSLLLLETNGGAEPIIAVALVTMTLLGFGLYVFNPNTGGKT